MHFLILLCLLFSACSKTSVSPPHQVARVSLAGDPISLDPRTARDLESITLLHMLFEGLARTAQDGSPELALAERVEISDNGLCYTFFLRDSRWSNGNLVTADDFVRSWKTILDPNFATDIAYHLYGIKNGKRAKCKEAPLDEVGVHAPDAKTLVVELEHPIPYFLELLTMSPFFPVSEEPVFNGPFALREWKHSNSLSLAKNTHYWQADQVALEGIELLIADPDTGLKLFEQGEVDWAGSPLSTIPADAIGAWKEKLQISPFAATYFFRVNTASEFHGKKNPLASAKLRKALALALDRKAITEHVLQGGHQPATRLVPPEMGLSFEGYFSDADMRKAKELIAEVKREEGEIAPVVLSYINSERNGAIAQAVQEQWKKALEISIELEAVESKVYFQRVSKRDFQLAAGSWTADFEDPINFLEVFKYKDASTNNTAWEKAEYIDLLDRSALCRSSEERKRLLCDAERILMEEMPVIPLFHFALNYLKEETLQGVCLSPIGRLDLRWAYWDEKK